MWEEQWQVKELQQFIIFTFPKVLFWNVLLFLFCFVLEYDDPSMKWNILLIPLQVYLLALQFQN